MTFSFRSRLLHSPFLPSLAQVIAQPQLNSEGEFAAYAAFALSSVAPILLSYIQRHALVRDIVASVRLHLGDSVECIVMNCRVPSGGRMPHELGDERIFLVNDLKPEIDRLTSARCSFVTIDERFVRHPLEAGDNGLDLDWHHQGADAAQRFARLSRELLALGLTETAFHQTERALT